MEYQFSQLIDVKNTKLADKYIWLNRKWKFPFLDIDWTNISTETAKKYFLREVTHTFSKKNWIVHREDEIIGIGHTSVNNLTDKNKINFLVYIRPEFRRKGIARNLIKKMLEYVNDSDFTIAHVDTNNISTNSLFIDYLVSLGFKKVYSERLFGAAFKEYDQVRIVNEAQEYKQTALSKGYSFEIAKDGNISILICSSKSFYNMRQEIWNDMPTEDAESEKEIYNEAVHRDMYKQIEDGDKSIMIVALKDDIPVGLSETWIGGDIPYLLHQGDTGVIKDYRGNKLGLTLKLLILEILFKEPKTKEVKYWITGNAGSNEHMIKINNYLNHKELKRLNCYEVDYHKFKASIF